MAQTLSLPLVSTQAPSPSPWHTWGASSATEAEYNSLTNWGSRSGWSITEMDRKTGEEHWTMKLLLYRPPESWGTHALVSPRQQSLCPPLPLSCLHLHSHRPSASAGRRHSCCCS